VTGTFAPTDRASVLRALLDERTSSRAFSSRAVPIETIEKILALAQRTPSWCNSQSWRLAVTSGAGTDRLRSALYDAARGDLVEDTDFEFPREFRGVHGQRRRESGFQLYDALGIPRGDGQRRREQMLQNFKLFGAPHVAIVHVDDALGPYGAVDCGAYVTSFLLAATAMGVDTVAQAALAMYPSVLRRELGLSDDRRIVCGISFGFADRAHPVNSYRTARADVADVVNWIDR
jgi:nitroreductase